MFDCYAGLDCCEKVSVMVKRNEQRPKEKETDDPDLEKPSMVEKAVNAIFGGKQEDEEEEGEAKNEEQGKKKKGKKGKKIQVEDNE